eukprot:TRINITY_DN2229_c0_g2_i2.p1 TRINITY_DN2229_c0_g2~~TRINITY_DN2229_c0_g2_i2.p1  ORF type:complete len:162 (+),score=44.08 TRINITY_DN2229_c0_g2_i2:107-592(+)
MQAQRRLEKELRELAVRPPCLGASVCVVDGNPFHWQASLTGPAGTPYAGGTFRLDLAFPPSYPFAPPVVAFATRVLHPSVSRSGAVCLDVLRPGVWTPAMSVARVLLAVLCLLCDTDPARDPPFDVAAACLLHDAGRAKYDEVVREWTVRFATPAAAAAVV